MLKVFSAASQIFSVYLFTRAVSEVVEGDSDLPLGRRVGFLVIGALIVVLEFVVDVCNSIPRYGIAVSFALFKVAMLVAGVVYTSIDIHDWDNATLVFVYICLALSMVIALYTSALKSWSILVRKRRIRQEAHKLQAVQPVHAPPEDDLVHVPRPAPAEADDSVSALPSSGVGSPRRDTSMSLASNMTLPDDDDDDDDDDGDRPRLERRASEV